VRLGLRLLAVLILTLALAPACGRYGPPRRTYVPVAGQPPSQVPLEREGTSILNPDSDAVPAPVAPPELPEEEEEIQP
jgi:hypothetical protein